MGEEAPGLMTARRSARGRAPRVATATALAAVLSLVTGPARGDDPPPAETTTAPPASDPGAPSGEPAEGVAAEGDGVFGPVRIGPLVGAGIATRPIDLGAMLVIDRTLGFGFTYAYIPKIVLDDSSLKAHQIGADLRWMPFGGAFFVGAGIGYQQLDATLAASAAGYTASSSVRIESPFITPRFGWLWIWNPGLALGLDAGVVIPFAFKTTVEGVEDQGLADMVGLVGKTVLPDIKLRLGFLF